MFQAVECHRMPVSFVSDVKLLDSPEIFDVPSGVVSHDARIVCIRCEVTGLARNI
jgi:hypothetical protein